MNKIKSTKRALIMSAAAVLMSISMLIGTTFAWFTDTASTGVNKIVSGNLDIELQYATAWNAETGAPTAWDKAEGKVLNFRTADNRTDNILWEPGATYQLPELRIVNNGNLALKYKIAIAGAKDANPNNGMNDIMLLDVIDWTYSVEGAGGEAAAELGTERHLNAKTTDSDVFDTLTIKGQMQTTAGNEYQGLSIDGIGITVYATQNTYENDSFGNTYDANATYYPVIDLAGLKDAIKNGGNVAVDADVEVSSVDTVAQRTIISKPTTLQLNKKITSPYEMGNNNTNFTALLVAADTTINAGEDGGIDTQGGAYGINVLSGANLVINGGTYYGGGTAVQVQKGTVTINGGHFAVEPFSDARYGYNFLLNCIDDNYKNDTAKIIVKGGTFVNFNPANCKAEGEGTNFVADGYGVVTTPQANGDVWYTVVPQ